MCRRNVEGPTGILAVMTALHAAVPEHVQFHLFGVKSQALRHLAALFPGRVASIDSMAWSMRARKHCHENGLSCNTEQRADAMEKWYRNQTYDNIHQ